jgi:hypothetical protein
VTWRAFRKWAGFPVMEDVPVCDVCGEKLTLGEWPAYPWVCRNDPHPPRDPGDAGWYR